MRPLLHTLANADDNAAVRRLAILCLRNGSPQRDTIVLLQGIAEEDGLDRDLRETASKVATALQKRANVGASGVARAGGCGSRRRGGGGR